MTPSTTYYIMELDNEELNKLPTHSYTIIKQYDSWYIIRVTQDQLDDTPVNGLILDMLVCKEHT